MSDNTALNSLGEARKIADHILTATKNSNNDSHKKRKSRWGDESQKVIIPGLPTILPSNMTEDQKKLYVWHLRIEEITRKLRINDFGIQPNLEDRSPSPEPIYNTDGKRLNTREVRYKKKMEDERHKLINLCADVNPAYKPPIDYRIPQQRIQERIMLPTELPPNTNFIGLIIGPRGISLKDLEKETNTKIMIRGKGSSKEGKFGKKDGMPLPGEDEPLHALVSGNEPDSVAIAVCKITEIIDDAIKNPGNDNELKKTQLAQLAHLNGTFKFEDLIKCTNCGSLDHRTWECPEQKNVTSQIRCSSCGSHGHISIDCKVNLATPTYGRGPQHLDEEYQSFKRELDGNSGNGVQAGLNSFQPIQRKDNSQPPKPIQFVPQLPGPPVQERSPSNESGGDRLKRGGGSDGRWNDRNNRNRTKRHFIRNDYGGYSWERGSFPSHYDMHPSPPPPRAAIPPPASIKTEDNPDGINVYEPINRRRQHWEIEDYGYGDYDYYENYNEQYNPAYSAREHHPYDNYPPHPHERGPYVAHNQPPPPGYQPNPNEIRYIHSNHPPPPPASLNTGQFHQTPQPQSQPPPPQQQQGSILIQTSYMKDGNNALSGSSMQSSIQPPTTTNSKNISQQPMTTPQTQPNYQTSAQNKPPIYPPGVSAPTQLSYQPAPTQNIPGSYQYVPQTHTSYQVGDQAKTGYQAVQVATSISNQPGYSQVYTYQATTLGQPLTQAQQSTQYYYTMPQNTYNTTYYQQQPPPPPPVSSSQQPPQPGTNNTANTKPIEITIATGYLSPKDAETQQQPKQSTQYSSQWARQNYHPTNTKN